MLKCLYSRLIGNFIVIAVFSLCTASLAAGQTTKVCSALASEYTHYAALIDKNRIMTFKYSEHISHQIKQWSLGRLYQNNSRNKKFKVFANTRGNLNLIASLERTITDTSSATLNTCEYNMGDIAGITGFQYSSDDFTGGVFGLYNAGGFGFAKVIEGVQQVAKSDSAIGIGSFFAMKAPFLLNANIESSLLYTSFSYESSIGESDDALKFSKGGVSVLRLNNYIAKYFLSGANAFQLKIGTNLEYWTNSAIERILNYNTPTARTFKATKDLSGLSIEPAVVGSYSRAWVNSSGNSTEVTFNTKLAYGIGSAVPFAINITKDYVDESPANEVIAVFDTTLIYGFGINVKQTFGPSISAEAGLSYDAMSGSQISSNDLLFSLGLAANF